MATLLCFGRSIKLFSGYSRYAKLVCRDKLPSNFSFRCTNCCKLRNTRAYIINKVDLLSSCLAGWTVIIISDTLKCMGASLDLNISTLTRSLILTLRLTLTLQLYPNHADPNPKIWLPVNSSHKVFTRLSRHTVNSSPVNSSHSCLVTFSLSQVSTYNGSH